MTNKTRAKPSRKTCLKCDKSFPLGGYYSTSDKEYYKDSKIPICKNCCQEDIEKRGFIAFQDLLRVLNKPLLDDLFDGDFYEYIKNINSLPQYRGMTFLESTLFKENMTLANKRRIKPTELSEEDLKESEDFWSIGKTEHDYIWLNTEFSDYLSRYEVDSKTLEDLIVEICLTRLDIRNRREAGQEVDKQIKTLNELLGSANLRPNQSSGNQSVDQETFSSLIRKFENERPIPEPDESWKDVDGIGRYIKTFFLGHMAKMFGKENPFIDEYEEEIGKHTVRPHRKNDAP